MRVALLSLLLLLSGCASVMPLLPGSEGRLAEANARIAEGRDQEAKRILNQLASAKQPSRVTDEALFHLALLQLRDEQEGPTTARATLEKLSRRSNAGLWGVEGGTLLRLIRSGEEARRQTRSLKDLNHSLTKENRELRLNIEQLKALDLQLEQKSRRP